MADTQRTIAALLTLLPDNTSGDISAQDLRDLVTSMKPGFGEIYLSTPVQTNITTQSVFQRLEGTTTLSTAPTAVNWSMPSAGRLRYDGEADRVVKLSANMCITTVGANKSLRFRVAKNGVTQAATEARQFMVVASQEENVSLSGIFEMTTNDYLEVWVSNETDATDLDAVNLVVDVISMVF